MTPEYTLKKQQMARQLAELEREINDSPELYPYKQQLLQEWDCLYQDYLAQFTNTPEKDN